MGHYIPDQSCQDCCCLACLQDRIVGYRERISRNGQRCVCVFEVISCSYWAEWHSWLLGIHLCREGLGFVVFCQQQWLCIFRCSVLTILANDSLTTGGVLNTIVSALTHYALLCGVGETVWQVEHDINWLAISEKGKSLRSIHESRNSKGRVWSLRTKRDESRFLDKQKWIGWLSLWLGSFSLWFMKSVIPVIHKSSPLEVFSYLRFKK